MCSMDFMLNIYIFLDVTKSWLASNYRRFGRDFCMASAVQELSIGTKWTLQQSYFQRGNCLPIDTVL